MEKHKRKNDDLAKSSSRRILHELLLVLCFEVLMILLALVIRLANADVFSYRPSCLCLPSS